ncbi:MAG: hypothetical protein WDM89_04315 [Rhizomicrobium sp.]
MAGIEAEDETVKEFAPSARTLDEQAVHGRRQPQHLHHVAKIGR